MIRYQALQLGLTGLPNIVTLMFVSQQLTIEVQSSIRMGNEHQLKKVKIPELSVLALSDCLTFLKPVSNLYNSRPIVSVL